MAMTEERFLQTPFWAEFKASHGWKTVYFLIHDENKLELLPSEKAANEAINERSLDKTNDQSFVLSVLVRSFTLAKIKRFSLAYIPMAPELKNSFTSQEEYASFISEKLTCLAEKIREHLPKDTLFIRFDPPVDFPSPEERDGFCKTMDGVLKDQKSLLQKAPVAVQPPDTTILDLTKSEEEILSSMKSKWRYNIRLASKKGVEVSRHFGNDSDFEDAFEKFYRLFQETSERDGVSFHGKDYYIDLLKRGAKSENENPLITLYLAKHEEDFLAGIITLFCGREAVYLYGASGNVKRNLMPAYLLQWTAIQDAKKYGSPCYDFYGMPPTGDENHPMHGLYLFKTGFGGQNTHRIGSYDFPLKKDYSLYLTAEKLRAWWFRKVVKKLHHR